MRIILDKYEPKEIIKFVRQSTGLTQEKFGKKIGKSKDTIQSYELGRNRMYLNDFIDITKQFNLQIIIEEKQKNKE